MRHGVAAPQQPELPDEQRPLTPKGRRKVRLVCEALQLLKVRFDLIVTSPILRAVQTARIVAEEFECEKRVTECPHLATGDHEGLIRWIQEELRGKNRLLLVGHEPYMGELAGLLVAGTTQASIAFKKAGVAFIEVPELAYGQCGTLRWLITPKIAARMIEGEDEDE